MELGLSLGEASSKPFFLAEKAGDGGKSGRSLLGLGFCMGLGGRDEEDEEPQPTSRREGNEEEREEEGGRRSSADPPPVQLNLLPFSPVHRQPSPSSHLGLPWSAENGNSEGSNRGLDVNMMPSTEEMEEGAAVSSSPNSTVSSFQMDFSAFRSGGGGGVGGGRNEGEAERASSRASDDEENGLTRKKLRLSKEQSAYLEESFKEHNTLNPKQKLALAKQLNLRPRQVEVWFQNRRARTKLKQTEVDCEYLKRCCEKLTQENRRLQKELQELRALKTSHPFYMQLPATTLTMCPSCERVATNSNSNSTATATATATATTPSGAHPAPAAAADHHVSKGNASNGNHSNLSGFPSLAAAKPRFYPFAAHHPQPQPATHQPSAAS